MQAIHAASTAVQIWYNDRDISADIAPMLVSFEYSDFAAGKIDDLQIVLTDPDGRWCGNWYPDKDARIRAKIIWAEGPIRRELPCGTFSVDEPEYSSPGLMTIKATAVSLGNTLRRERHTQHWKRATLKEIARRVAIDQKADLQFRGEDTPPLSKLEQKDESDLGFLLRICEREHYGLKFDSGPDAGKRQRLIIYQRTSSDASPAVMTIRREMLDVAADDGIIRVDWSFRERNVDTYRACKVRYNHPDSGLLTATYPPQSNEPQPAGADVDGHVLIIRKHCENQAEAIRLAKAEFLRANRNNVECDMTTIGDTRLSAGLNVNLEGWGKLDGKYAIDEAVHTVVSGYSTKLQMVRVGSIQ